MHNDRHKDFEDYERYCNKEYPMSKEILCDSCGKSMYYDAWVPTGRNSGFSQDPNKQMNFIGISIEVPGDVHNFYMEEFLQKQVGKYKLDKTYSVCWECWLDSLFRDI